MSEEAPPASEPDESSSADDVAADSELEAAQDKAEVFDRTFRNPFNELLRAQSDLLRNATKPSLERFAEQQADLFRIYSTPLFQNLTANLGVGKLIASRNLTKPFGDALSKLAMPPSAFMDSLPQISTIFELPWLESLRTDLTRLIPKVDFDAIRRGMLRASPPNWQDLPDEANLLELWHLTEAGIPTAWVPRASVLAELVNTEAADRGQVLEAHQTDLIEDCSAVLADISSEELREQTVLLEEAFKVARLGHLYAAQALAASIFDTTLRHTFDPQHLNDFYKTVEKSQRKPGYYPKVTDTIKRRDENNTLRELRWGLVYMPVLVVLGTFKSGKVPSAFNRHATAHAAGLTQYNTVNALVSLLLATSLLREAQQELLDTSPDET